MGQIEAVNAVSVVNDVGEEMQSSSDLEILILLISGTELGEENTDTRQPLTELACFTSLLGKRYLGWNHMRFRSSCSSICSFRIWKRKFSRFS